MTPVVVGHDRAGRAERGVPAPNHLWSGTGITSTTAAANAHMGVAVLAQRAGELFVPGVLEMDGNSVVVLSVLNGDSDFDGRIDGSDYFRLDHGHLASSQGPGAGDFNYDNRIDGDDYFLIDQAFLKQSSIAAPGAAAPASGDPFKTVEPSRNLLSVFTRGRAISEALPPAAEAADDSLVHRVGLGVLVEDVDLLG